MPKKTGNKLGRTMFRSGFQGAVCAPDRLRKQKRPRSANLLQMPRGLMCKRRQRGRGYGGPGPEGSRGIDPSFAAAPLRAVAASPLRDIGAQKKATDDHGGSRFAPDACPMSQNVPFQLMPISIGFLDCQCEKSFICRHNLEFNADAVESVTLTCAYFSVVSRLATLRNPHECCTS
jgi:hypothetical protein